MSKMITVFTVFFTTSLVLAQTAESLPGILRAPAFVSNTLNDASDFQFKPIGNFSVSLARIEKAEDKELQSIEIKNDGGNFILPQCLYYSSRTWEFTNSDGKSQDLGLFITDQPSDGTLSHEQDSWMGFYPRKYLTSYRIEGTEMTVTLPTGEEVVFDADHGIILRGVLAETDPMALGSKKPNAPKVIYTGTGVMIRADSVSGSPQKNGFAVVTKSGKTCKIPKNQFWPDTSEASSFHFKFVTDEELDQFLMRTCHFGLYEESAPRR